MGKITYTSYNAKELETKEILDLNELVLANDRKVKWLDISCPDNPGVVQSIGNKFNLHPLVIEDILNNDHMPKLEDFDEYLVLIIKSMSLDQDEKLVTDQYSFVLSKDMVISFQQSESDIFKKIITKLNEGANIRRNGADDLLHALTDTIVDNYFEVIEIIGENLDEVEDRVLLNPQKDLLEEIYKLKRELIYIRRVLWPMRNAISSMAVKEYDLIDGKTIFYFKDIDDHILQMINIVETYRDISTGILDTYLSSISNKTNDIMKVLTIYSTIFIPLTFIAGVYGMNFKYLPELNWKYGYISFWLVSAIITGFLLRFFKKKDWL